tara:strand:- start:311 stop:565 length:255 start_codon:yes stop_codon:yes gene_type:complete
MSTVFKNIECSVTQLAITMSLIDKYIEEQNEMIEIYTNKLNGAYSTDDVKFCQEVIKDKKANIKLMLDLQNKMSTKQLITKHTL